MMPRQQRVDEDPPEAPFGCPDGALRVPDLSPGAIAAQIGAARDLRTLHLRGWLRRVLAALVNFARNPRRQALAELPVHAAGE